MYTTVTRVLDENKATDTTSANPPDATVIRKVMTSIMKVTKRLQVIAWDFEPTYRTETFTPCNENVNNWQGLLTLVNSKGQQFLLASASDMPVITVNNGQVLTFDLTAASSPQVLPYPQNHTSIKVLRLNDANNSTSIGWYPTQLPFFDSISITGWWGYRKGYANAYIDSLDTVRDNPLSASATSVTVTDTSGADAYFNTPRFSPGNLIRVDNELMLVAGTDIAGESLNVRRAQNGTTAVGHAQGTKINIWYPEEDVMDTVSRQAAYFYARRGSYESTVISGVATSTYPSDMVNELYAMLEGYQNE